MQYQSNPALDIGTHSQSEVIASIRAGFPLEVFKRIADRLTMTEKQLAALTNITTSTPDSPEERRPTDKTRIRKAVSHHPGIQPGGCRV